MSRSCHGFLLNLTFSLSCPNPLPYRLSPTLTLPFLSVGGPAARGPSATAAAAAGSADAIAVSDLSLLALLAGLGWLVVAVGVPTLGLMLLQPSLDPRLPALCASSSVLTDSSFSCPRRYRWSCPVSGAGLVDVRQVFGCGSWFPDGGLTRLSFERLVAGRHRLCTVDGLGKTTGEPRVVPGDPSRGFRLL